MQKPHVVISADWSISEKKRWMTRAELRPDRNAYLVHPSEPVGNVATLFERLQRQAQPSASILVGLDFPIGLPRAYATKAGLRQGGFRKALEMFAGEGEWQRFYEVSANPDSRRPFYPPPTQVKGEYTKAALVRALGLGTTLDMLRYCDRSSATRAAAESMFFTLGGKQVGRAMIEGWRALLKPSLDRIRLWPFDGELSSLLAQPGIVVAEIYPGEAYSHLGLAKGIGKGLSKRRRQDRASVGHAFLSQANPHVEISSLAIRSIETGFHDEDDFDATAGLFSMLQVVTGRRAEGTPTDPDVREMEGWILGQQA